MGKHACHLLFLSIATLCGAATASGAAIPITFGREVRRLQDLVDRRYGANHVDVTRDYIGAHPGDLDPWFWAGDRIGSVRVRTLKRDPDRSVIGWYLDGDKQARLPAGGGTLFYGHVRPHEETVVLLPGFHTCFGFYIDANDGRPVKPGAPASERFYTNRTLNDCGIDGTGAIHAPFDGDVQALIFDVSRWAGPDTWLVCFEDGDTGGNLLEDDSPRVEPGAGTHDEDDVDGHDRRFAGSDCDFDDVVFEVRADGATAARSLSFGGLKLIYR